MLDILHADTGHVGSGLICLVGEFTVSPLFLKQDLPFIQYLSFFLLSCDILHLSTTKHGNMEITGNAFVTGGGKGPNHNTPFCLP